MQGDLGVQSGLVATNGSELAALKRLGERNYFEFKLGKTKQPQRVGDITLLLKKADPKKNKYTVDVMADDKLTVKQDKSINEPVESTPAKLSSRTSWSSTRYRKTRSSVTWPRPKKPPPVKPEAGRAAAPACKHLKTAPLSSD